MTTTAPSRRSTLFSVLFKLFQVGVFIWSAYLVLHPDGPISAWPFILGIITIPVSALFGRIGFVGFIIFGIVVLGFLASDSWAHDYVTGMALFAVITYGLAVGLWLGEAAAERKATAPTEPLAHAGRIIGLSGYAGAGKDTAAAGLLEHGWKRVAVSDKIAELALRIDPPVYVPWSSEPFFDHAPVVKMQYIRLSNVVARHGWTEAKRFDAVRQLLQDLGVGVRDVVDPDAWVTATMRDLPEGDLVFTSVRFPNEAQAIKDAGGHIVRVQRPMVDAANDHITEVALDDWPFDAYLNNDRDAAAAGNTLRGIVESLHAPDGSPTTR